MASKPSDLAERMSNRNALADVDLYEIFKLPVEAARAKAREIISQAPKSGQLTIVDRWRQLPDGRIELTTRRMQAGD
jgi:hypothetical protein